MASPEFEVIDEETYTGEEVKMVTVKRGDTWISFELHMTEARMNAISKFMQRINSQGPGTIIQSGNQNEYAGRETVSLRLQDGIDEPRLEYSWLSWKRGGLYLRMKNADVAFDEKAENDILNWLETQYY
jgi:hypothetical protein